MKAIIMAGGQGTRLRPLTCELPKPLCPLLDKPVILYILELLEGTESREAVVTLGYQGSKLERALRDYGAIPLRFSREEHPLGTAGGVKHAAGGEPEELIVLSGDAMCDFDLNAAVRFHREKGAMATIVTHRVPDPREYGLVCTDRDGRVESFVEKPSYAGCVTDCANTGVYILSPEVLDLIEGDKPCDFAKDVFPRMLEEGLPIYACEEKGYWCDIGDLQSYLRCQADMLDGKVRFRHEATRTADGSLVMGRSRGVGSVIKPPVYIGRNVSIGEGSVIGPHTVLGCDVRIGRDCTIEGSVLQPGATTGDGVALQGMVACENTSFEDGSSAHEGSAVGEAAVVSREATISEGVHVWPRRTVEEGVTLREDLLHGQGREVLIGDEGIIGPTNVVVTPEFCARLGSGVASLAEFPAVGVGFSYRPASRALAYAAMAGVMAAGANVWNFGACIESQFEFCMAKSQVDFGIFLDAGSSAAIRVRSAGGLPMRREFERKLEAAINRREYRRAGPEQMGGETDIESMAQLYRFELMKLCDAPLEQLTVNVRAAVPEVKKLLEDVLERLGCRVEGARNGGRTPIVINLPPDGKRVSLSCGEIGLPYERVLAAVCISDFLRGESVALPLSAPKMIDMLAERYGSKVYRYSECPCSDRDEAARQKAAARPYLRDGLMLAVRLLSFMVQQKLSFRELAALVPDFGVSTRVVPITGNPSAVVRKLRAGGSALPEGVELTHAGARAFVRPAKSGRGILILTECMQSETAAEFGDFFERTVREVVESGGD